MKCKKILIITLVSLLLVSSLSPITYAKFSILSNNREKVEDTGTIEKQKLSSADKIYNIFLINGDKGTLLFGRVYKKYVPINLPEEFKKEGMRVEFTGEISLRHIFSARGLSSLINLRALPIKIIDIKEIENKPDLKLDIYIDESFGISKTILAKAVLSNAGDASVTLSDMILAGQTLYLDIKNPSGEKINYYGPMIIGWPKLITLEPNQAVTEEISLSDGNWARTIDEKTNGGYPWYENPGKYSIQAAYSPRYIPDDTQEPLPDPDSKPAPSGYIDEQGRWHGKILSRIHEFDIDANLNPSICGTVRVSYSIPITQFTPIPDAKVVAIKKINSISSSAEDIPEGAYVTYTDEQGKFELYAQPGNYTILVSKEGFESRSRNVHIEENSDAVTLGFALKPLVNLALEVSIDSSFEENAPISLGITLVNKGEYSVAVSEMALDLETLDLCITMPKGEQLCYIGPVIKRLPDTIVIKPGLENAYKVNIEDIRNLFGTDSTSDAYIFEPGSYSIQAHYESGKSLGENWQGKLSSKIHKFNIQPARKFTIVSPHNEEVVRGMVEVIVSFTNYDPNKVEFRVDEGEWTEIICVIGCSVGFNNVATCHGFGTYSLNTTQIKNGKHTIEARLHERYSDSYVYDSIEVTVNNEPKQQFSIESPSDGDKVTGSVKVTGYTYFVFPLPNIKEIYVSIDRGEWQKAKLYGLGVPNSGNQIGYWEYELDTVEYGNGEHRIGIMGFNGIENTYDSIHVFFANELTEK